MTVSNWSFLMGVAILLLTPGPTNTLLAAAGSQRGARQSLFLIPFEGAGYCLSTTAWGLLQSSVLGTHPHLLHTLQVLSGLYILHMAWKLWRATTLTPGGITSPTFGGRTLFVATALNPKAAIFAIALFPHQTWDQVTNYLPVMASFLMLVACAGFLWIAFGFALVAGRIAWLNVRTFNRLAALLLCAFATLLLLKGLLPQPF